MQAILLAAGQSSRFYPFNQKHKSLTTVMGEPIISHTIKAINNKTKINEFIIVTDPKNQVQEILGDGKDLGVKIEYVTLKEPTGMGDALLEAEEKTLNDFLLVHSYHADFPDIVGDYRFGEASSSTLFVKKEKNLSGYGVVTLSKDRVTGVIEKPEDGKAPSEFKIVGVYFLKKDFIPVLKETKREHYSFEKALDKYAKQNELKAKIVETETLSLKYPWELLAFKNYLLSGVKKRISKNAKISDKAKIEGNVVIEDGVEISENAVIKGPCYIGKNVFIGTNSLVRDGTCLEEGVKVGAFMEIKNSLVMEGTTFHSGYMGDSLIGRNSKVGSQFNTANVRLDRQTVFVSIKENKINTDMKFLGAIIGENAVIGGNVSIMPGVIVGNNVNIGPSTSVMKNIESDTIFYTKFSEHIQKTKN